MPDTATVSPSPKSTPPCTALYVAHVFVNRTFKHFSECEIQLLTDGCFSFSFLYFVQFGVLGKHLYMSLFKAGHGVHSPNTHSDLMGFHPLLVASISSTETSESRSSTTLVALVCAYWSVHISCSWWNMVHTFAFFLCGSFDFARDAAESLPDAL